MTLTSFAQHTGRLHDQQNLEDAGKRREKILEDRKDKVQLSALRVPPSSSFSPHLIELTVSRCCEQAHKEVEHAKEVAAKVKQQKDYVDQRAGKWDTNA
jgi:hypothetical protein